MKLYVLLPLVLSELSGPHLFVHGCVLDVLPSCQTMKCLLSLKSVGILFVVNWLSVVEDMPLFHSHHTLDTFLCDCANCSCGYSEHAKFSQDPKEAAVVVFIYDLRGHAYCIHTIHTLVNSSFSCEFLFRVSDAH